MERREGDTRVEVCCGAKPGLLLSTVNTLEALGLEIQQCVISCFSDFAMQASCSEVFNILCLCFISFYTWNLLIHCNRGQESGQLSGGCGIDILFMFPWRGLMS